MIAPHRQAPKNKKVAVQIRRPKPSSARDSQGYYDVAQLGPTRGPLSGDVSSEKRQNFACAEPRSSGTSRGASHALRAVSDNFESPIFLEEGLPSAVGIILRRNMKKHGPPFKHGEHLLRPSDFPGGALTRTAHPQRSLNRAHTTRVAPPLSSRRQSRHGSESSARLPTPKLWRNNALRSAASGRTSASAHRTC